MAAQKSIQKLQQMKQTVQEWSCSDQKISIITNGVGGQKNTFRTAQDYLTNDPAFFKNRSISHTSRYAKLGPVSATNKFTVEDPVN